MCFLSSTSNEKQELSFFFFFLVCIILLSCLIYWFFCKQMQKYAHKIHSILFIVNYLTIHNIHNEMISIQYPLSSFLVRFFFFCRVVSLILFFLSFFFLFNNKIDFYRDNKSLRAKRGGYMYLRSIRDRKRYLLQICDQ